jgi:hypothetical protein
MELMARTLGYRDVREALEDRRRKNVEAYAGEERRREERRIADRLANDNREVVDWVNRFDAARSGVQ